MMMDCRMRVGSVVNKEIEIMMFTRPRYDSADSLQLLTATLDYDHQHYAFGPTTSCAHAVLSSTGIDSVSDW